jgi:hypothetical protein
MSDFREADQPRHSDGTFGTKGQSAAEVKLALDEADRPGIVHEPVSNDDGIRTPGFHYIADVTDEYLEAFGTKYTTLRQITDRMQVIEARNAQFGESDDRATELNDIREGLDKLTGSPDATKRLIANGVMLKAHNAPILRLVEELHVVRPR